MFKFLFGSKEKNKSHYKTLTIANVIRETSDSIVIQFQQPDKEKISYKAGQFLTLITEINGEKLRRSYSLSSSPETDDALDVCIKRVPNGKVSNFLNDTAKVGQNIEVMYPAGSFFVEPQSQKQRQIVLIGAGSGITPLMGIAKSILKSEPESTILLLYGNRTENSIIFYQQLTNLQKQHLNRFQIEYILSQPHDGWQGQAGRLNQHLTLQLLEKHTLNTTAEFFICGPAGMMEEVQHALKILNIQPDKIYKESFVTSETEKAKGEVQEGTKTDLQSREVTLLYEGTEYKIQVSPKQTILEAGLKANIDLPYSCQSGLCTACRGKCLSGKVKLEEEEGLTPKEREMGYVLTCVGHPLTEDVVIEIG
jgi:ring-1,2-phenylacetyl-CoA epoxidase subunit PaaE